jgi:cell division septum initiation protein DivIVA
MSEPNRQYHQALSANRKLLEENARLKAEVKRLTEAGNHLWAFAHNCVMLQVYPKTAQEKINIWNAAKEGETK